MFNNYDSNDYREVEKVEVNEGELNKIFLRNENGVIEEINVPDDTEEE